MFFSTITCSLLVSKAGRTSFTVLSTSTPPTRRKHFLEGSTSFRVSITKLEETTNKQKQTLNPKGFSLLVTSLVPVTELKHAEFLRLCCLCDRGHVFLIPFRVSIWWLGQQEIVKWNGFLDRICRGGIFATNLCSLISISNSAALEAILRCSWRILWNFDITCHTKTRDQHRFYQNGVTYVDLNLFWSDETITAVIINRGICRPSNFISEIQNKQLINNLIIIIVVIRIYCSLTSKWFTMICRKSWWVRLGFLLF